MAPTLKPPLTEIGGQGNVGGVGFGTPGWQAFNSEGERVPELKWPQSVQHYEWMQTDSQVDSLYSATALPLLDYVWWVQPDPDAPEATQRALADDLGLPYDEPDPEAPYEPPGPGSFGFTFIDHLQEALLAMCYGHYHFEMVGAIAEVDGLWHVTKLAPRAPQTIMAFNVNQAGDLLSIQQNGVVMPATGPGLPRIPPPIPVDRLVAYVWRADARNRYVGRSMLRSLYRHWLVKDLLIRIDAINHERAGGVPYVKTDATFQGYDLKELQELASAFRVGENGGAALPPGADLALARVGGTNVIDSIRYHDEAMARVWQAMVIQLGQTTTGSRALGGTFQDLQSFARRAIARWFAVTFRQQLMASWWAYNVGTKPDGRPLPHPALACRPPQPDAAASQLKQQAVPGVAPELGQGSAEPVVNPQMAAPSPQATIGGGARGPYRGRERGGPGSSPSRVAAALTLPDRPLRRKPSEGELRAAVNFQEIDHVYETGVNQLEAFWRSSVIPDQIVAVEAGIVQTKKGTLRQRVTRADMSKLTVPALGAERLGELMLPAARQGALGAVQEAAAQGVTLQVPSDATLALMVADHAQAVANEASTGMALAAQRKAAQLASGRTPGQVASETVSYLQGLKHQWTIDQLRGATQMAVNGGRFTAMGQHDGPVRYEASELLDTNTCDPCGGEDGEEFGSLDEAMAAYPSGGFVDCEGGPRCRGLVVAVYPEA